MQLTLHPEFPNVPSSPLDAKESPERSSGARTAVNTHSALVLLPKMIMVVLLCPPLPVFFLPGKTRENLDGSGDCTATLCSPHDLEQLNVLHTIDICSC